MVSWKELPYILKIGLVTLGILLLAGGAYLFALRPLEKANEADALTLRAKEAEVAQLSPYKAKLTDLLAQTDRLKAQIEEQRKVVPEEKEVPSFISLLFTESTGAGVEVRRYSPKETVTKEYYVEVPFEIDVDGPYQSVLNFYERLQKLQRIVTVKGLAMSGIKSNKTFVKRSYKWSPSETVTATCTVTTFYSTSKGGATPAPPPAVKR